MQAVNEFDLITGIDIHIVLVPAPPSPTPIPTPLPHPFIGFVFNPLDWIPFFNKVKVNGFPAASVTSGGMPLPPLHMPMPPGLPGLWAKGKVGDDAMMLMGGLTVSANGKAMTYDGLMVLSCSCIGSPPVSPPDPKKMTAKQKLAVALGYLPTSMVTAIPKGLPVSIGCPPTIDLMALAIAFAFKAAFSLAGSAIRSWQRNSPRWERFSNFLHGKAGERNWLNRAICFLTGHPVDIATGKVFTDHTDFEIPGPIPLKWERVWFSTSIYQGPLGHGWHHSYDWALRYDPIYRCLFIRMDDGREIEFPELPIGEEAYNRQEKMLLKREKNDYVLRNAQGLYYRFRAPLERNPKPQALLSIENAAGFSIKFQYNITGQLAQIIDSTGRVFRLNTDAQNRITSIDAPHPEKAYETFTIVSYQYDSNNNLIKAADALQNAFNYAYDNHLLVKETNRNGLSFYFQYDGKDENAWCIHTWGDGGIYDHKLCYNKIEKWTIVENSLGHKTKYFWNDLGTVYKTVDPLGNEKIFRYGTFSQVIAEIDELGHATYRDYDDWGNNIRTTFPDGSKIEYQYNENMLLAIVDQNGGKWELEYNDQDLLISKKDPLGRTTKHRYENNLLTQIIDPAGNKTTIGYDQHFNVTNVVSPNGAVREWVYDYLGRCTLSTDPKGNIQKCKFNFNSWVRQIDEPDGNKKEIEYDSEGNVLRFKDKDHDVRYEYRGLKCLKARVEAGTRVEFKYNSEEDLIGIINEHGYVYRFELDFKGNVVVESGFDSVKRRYKRDPAGRMVEVARANGLITRFEYDSLDRITEVQHSDGSNEKFLYRSDGELLEAANNNIKISFERDKLGQVLKEKQSSFLVESKYDLLGWRSELSSSLGAHIVFDRNEMGYIETISTHSQENNWNATFERDNIGLEVERLFPGGVRSEWKRNKSGLPLEQKTVTVDSNVTRVRQYVWEINDRLKQIVDVQKGSWKFEHDVFDNLVSAQYPDGSFEHRMPDEVGNLFHNRNRTDRKYGPAGQLLEANGTRYEYDAEGNLIQKTNANGAVWRYDWNASGMLRQVVRPDGDVVLFTYDALGRRIAKQYRNRTTRWVWDGDVMLHEWVEQTQFSPILDINLPKPKSDSTIKILKSNEQIAKELNYAHPVTEMQFTQKNGGVADELTTWLFEPESFAPLAKFKGKEQYGIVTDHLGTPLEMYNTDGLIIWEMDLSIYGEVQQIEGWRESCPFRYPGQYEDVETGLYYNRFRYYDPQGGCYTSQDPIGLSGGRNLYSYVQNPLEWIDPFGLTGTIDGNGFFAPSNEYGRGSGSGRVRIPYQGSRGRDFTEANRRAGFTNGTPDGYTWHHANYNSRTGYGDMQLVRTSVHSHTPHSGGVSDFVASTGHRYDTRSAVEHVENSGRLRGRPPC